MANIDYVIVGPGPSLADVTTAVRDATRSVLTDAGWLHPSDERAALRVIADPDSEGCVVQVHYAGDPVTRRHELARTVYDSLAASTNWDLTWDSDDAQDVLAERTEVKPVTAG